MPIRRRNNRPKTAAKSGVALRITSVLATLVKRIEVTNRTVLTAIKIAATTPSRPIACSIAGVAER